MAFLYKGPRPVMETMQGPRTAVDMQTEIQRSSRAVRLNNGTRYLCTKEDLAVTQGLIPFVSPVPLMSIEQAISRILRWNHIDKIPMPDEAQAIQRFAVAVKQPFGPDLAIKAYRDLDLIFFGGVLFGNSYVTWVCQPQTDWLGRTQSGPRRGRTSKISMNAGLIWIMDHDDAYKIMISTLLQSVKIALYYKKLV